MRKQENKGRRRQEKQVIMERTAEFPSEKAEPRSCKAASRAGNAEDIVNWAAKQAVQPQKDKDRKMDYKDPVKPEACLYGKSLLKYNIKIP